MINTLEQALQDNAARQKDLLRKMGAASTYAEIAEEAAMKDWKDKQLWDMKIQFQRFGKF